MIAGVLIQCRMNAANWVGGGEVTLGWGGQANLRGNGRCTGALHARPWLADTKSSTVQPTKGS